MPIYSTLTLQDAEEQPQATKPVPISHRRQGHLVPRIDPLLREIPPGGKAAPIQGLDWFCKSLLQDEDGDYATDFLEERQTKPSERQTKPSGGRGPAAKRLHLAALQSHKGEASPARVSRLTLERGNVTSSNEPSFNSSDGTNNKKK